MGRERQKAKSRSSVAKVKHKSTGRTKSGRRKVDFLGNKAVAENWDRNQTVSQNYKRLGLSSRLNAAAGGVEPRLRNKGKENRNADPLAVLRTKKDSQLLPQTVQVERDPETGKILRVIQPEGHEAQTLRKPNPLKDPLNDLESDQEDVSEKDLNSKGVVAALEEQAAEEAESLAKKRPRQQSKREEDWVERLVERHGSDYGAMARDRKFNPMQQSEGDISRRVRKFMENRKKTS